MLRLDLRELRVGLDRQRSAAAMTIMTMSQKPATTFRLANISRSGMFIEADGAGVRPAEGSALHFALHLDEHDEGVTGVGLVRWVRDRSLSIYRPAGFGLQVLEFHEQAERRYLEFLEACLLNLKITDLMDPNFASVGPDVAVSDVLKLMTARKSDCVVVADGGGAPLGIFSTADVPRLAGRLQVLKQGVGLHMNPALLTLSVESETEDAYSIMRNGTLMHIPVIDDGVVIGMLAARDLVRYWAEYMELQSKRLARNYERAMSMIAHDLRTPIGLIQMTNVMLTSGEVTPAEYMSSGFAEVVDDRCSMMMGLIDDILDVQRIKAGLVRLNRDHIDTEELVRKIIRAFMPAANAKRINLGLKIQSTLPKIKADPLRLEQVFNNLISNALKFSYEGASVEVNIATRHSQVEISVVDHGPGIAAHELNGLFQEYGNVSTQPTKGEKRTGLGLAIAKRLVEAHGGTISVQTKQGVGTTFTVLLPIDALQ